MVRRTIHIATTLILGLAVASGPAGCGERHNRDRASGEVVQKETARDARPDGHDAREGERDEHQEGVVVLSPEAAERARIQVAVAEERVVLPTLRTTARIGFDERRLAHVSPRIPGRAHEVRADLGDDVRSGQVLAVLDSVELGEAKAEYLTAKAEEELTRKTLAREERLYADKISSEQSVIEARAEHEKALATLRSDAEKLRLFGLAEQEIDAIRYNGAQASLFSLRAPLDGRIVDKHLVLGELISPGDNVFTVADLSNLWVWIDVYERDLARVHPDDVVALMVQTYSGRVFGGKVGYVRDEIDPDTRTARARIDIANPDGALKPGMFAEVTVTDPHAGTPDTARRALAVPASAVQREGDRWIAFVQEGEHRYRLRELRIGTASGDLIEVIEGLSPGEPVVISGAFLLKSEAAKESLGGGHHH